MQATREQIEACDYYYSLGKSRSLAKVSHKCGRCDVTIKRWSRKLNWQALVQQRDSELGDQIIARTNQEIIGIHEMNREISTTLVRGLLGKVRDGKFQIASIADWKRVVEVQQLVSQIETGVGDGNLKSLAEVLERSAQMLGLSTDTKVNPEGYQ